MQNISNIISSTNDLLNTSNVNFTTITESTENNTTNSIQDVLSQLGINLNIQ
jgi:hypothetical protein